MSKSKFIVPVVLLLAGVALGFLGMYFFWGSIGGSYGVFVLRSGDIYVGSVKPFSKYMISDPWYVRLNQTGTTTEQYLVSWDKGTIWQAQPSIYINPSEVSVMSYLKSDSQVIKALNDAKSQNKSAIRLQ